MKKLWNMKKIDIYMMSLKDNNFNSGYNMLCKFIPVFVRCGGDLSLFDDILLQKGLLISSGVMLELIRLSNLDTRIRLYKIFKISRLDKFKVKNFTNYKTIMITLPDYEPKTIKNGFNREFIRLYYLNNRISPLIGI